MRNLPLCFRENKNILALLINDGGAKTNINSGEK